MASLAEIRAKLKAQENKDTSNSGGDNAIYPFWNMKDGDQSTLRFLPDGDPNNTFFWTERLMIRLPFSGVKGDMNSKPVVVQVPCMEMYGETCPILSEVRGWFKDPSLEDMGRKYWKKRSYIFQGFVVEDGLKEEQTPENPIRRFIIGPQIFQLIKSALMDPDMEELPTDYDAGVDFRLIKTSKGGYADYSTSTWARRESALTEAQRSAVDAHGLHNLGDFLPKKPDDVAVRALHEMFEASVDGQPYDPDRFGNYFRPYGVDAPAGGAKSPAPVAAAQTPAVKEIVKEDVPFEQEPVVETKPEPVVPAAKPAVASSSDSGKSAEDILAMIRNRQKS